MIDFLLDNDDYAILKILNVKPATFEEILNSTKMRKELLDFKLKYLSNNNFDSYNSKSKTKLIHKKVLKTEHEYGEGYLLLNVPTYSKEFYITDTGRVYYEYNKKARKSNIFKSILSFCKFIFTSIF